MKKGNKGEKDCLSLEKKMTRKNSKGAEESWEHGCVLSTTRAGIGTHRSGK